LNCNLNFTSEITRLLIGFSGLLPVVLAIVKAVLSSKKRTHSKRAKQYARADPLATKVLNSGSF
jgi:hypothetical protein